MVRRRYAVLLMVACGGASAAAGVEPPRLSAQEIKETVVGAVLSVDTPFGSTLPIKYGEDGSLAGEAGSLSFFLGASSDRGRWWIAENRLCHKWSVWFGAEPQCLRLQRDGQRILWQRDDGTNGTATIVSRSGPIVRREPQVAALEPQPAEAAPPRSAAPVGRAVAAPQAVAPKRSVSSPAPAPQPALPAKGQARPKVLPKIAKAPVPEKPVPEKPVPEKAPSGKAPAAKTALAAPVLAQAVPAPQRTARPAQTVGTRSLAVEASFRVAGVEDDDVLNVRGGPSQDYASVGVLLPRERGVRIVGACHEDWCPIRHGTTGGWVNRYYLAEEPPVWASEDLGPSPRR